ncbi:MAG: hypothetical protein ABI679_13815 [Gemmatimonadota bacterium]
MKHRLPLLWFLFVAAACSSPGGPDQHGNVLTLENRSSSTLVAYPLISGHLVDPVPILQAGTYDSNLIRPGSKLAVDTIAGYRPGMGVDLFLYIVRSDNSAHWLTSQAVTAEEIRERHGVIRITALPR